MDVDGGFRRRRLDDAESASSVAGRRARRRRRRDRGARRDPRKDVGGAAAAAAANSAAPPRRTAALALIAAGAAARLRRRVESALNHAIRVGCLRARCSERVGVREDGPRRRDDVHRGHRRRVRGLVVLRAAAARSASLTRRATSRRVRVRARAVARRRCPAIIAEAVVVTCERPARVSPGDGPRRRGSRAAVCAPRPPRASPRRAPTRIIRARRRGTPVGASRDVQPTRRQLSGASCK